jgi:ATP-dependent Lon protease
LTGSLGQVMQESARAALSYVRSISDRLGVKKDFWARHDIHVHIPAGAQPKDGPSAGVTMAVALASLATGKSVRSDVGMTGELSLRGKVLAIGGLKEKVLAAHRAGLSTVIVPRRNEVDLEDVPDEIRQEMKFVLADTVDDVLNSSLLPASTRKATAGERSGNGRPRTRPSRRRPAEGTRTSPRKSSKS